MPVSFSNSTAASVHHSACTGADDVELLRAAGARSPAQPAIGGDAADDGRVTFGISERPGIEGDGLQ